MKILVKIQVFVFWAMMPSIHIIHNKWRGEIRPAHHWRFISPTLLNCRTCHPVVTGREHKYEQEINAMMAKNSSNVRLLTGAKSNHIHMYLKKKGALQVEFWVDFEELQRYCNVKTLRKHQGCCTDCPTVTKKSRNIIFDDGEESGTM